MRPYRERNDYILRLANRGLEWHQIAALVNQKFGDEGFKPLTGESAYRVAKMNGWKSKPRTRETTLRAIALMQQGFTPSETAEMTGLRQYQVRNIRSRSKRAGIQFDKEAKEDNGSE